MKVLAEILRYAGFAAFAIAAFIAFCGIGNAIITELTKAIKEVVSHYFEEKEKHINKLLADGFDKSTVVGKILN
jgi:hypothetical protein